MARRFHSEAVWTRVEWLVVHLRWTEGYLKLAEIWSSEVSKTLCFSEDARDEKLAKTLRIKI